MKFTIDWVAKRKLFFAVSSTLLAGSLVSIFTKGFNYGIDFTGGTLVQVTYETPKTLKELRADLGKAGFPAAQPQSFSGTSSFAILEKGADVQDPKLAEEIVAGLQKADPAAKLRVDRKEFVGPTVGKHLKRQATKAIFLAVLAIIAYVAFRFHNPLWGAAGVAAIPHDIIITAGLFSVLGLEIDLVIIAAFLTIAGYSINDTIVIFDRMRENLRSRRGVDMRTLVNDSVNECLSRTIITNSMVFAVVLALFLLGGAVIHNFALAMLVGAMLGTYSTVGVSISLLYQWAGDDRDRSSQPKVAKLKPAGKK
jgi:preprotein translocase subunit SecF